LGLFTVIIVGYCGPTSIDSIRVLIRVKSRLDPIFFKLVSAEVNILTSNGKKGLPCIPTGFLPDPIPLLSMLFAWILLSLASVSVVPVQAAETDHLSMVNCNIHESACTQELPNSKVTLDISPKPVKAMTDLLFRLTLTEKPSAEAPYIDLGMPGMKMGPNRVHLKHRGEGVYEGTGIIVRCPSGKRVWKAVANVPDQGAVEFVFDVIY